MNFVETMRRAAVRGAQTAYNSVAAAKEGVVSTSRSRVVKVLAQAAEVPCHSHRVLPEGSWFSLSGWRTPLGDRLVVAYKQPYVSAFQEVVKKDSEAQKKLFDDIQDKMVKNLSVQMGGKTVTGDALFEEPYLSLLKIKAFGISEKELDEFKEGNTRKFARIKDVNAATREKMLKAVIVLSVEVGIFGQEIIRFLRGNDTYKTLMAHLAQRPADPKHPDHTFAFCSALLGSDLYRDQLMTEVRIQMATGLQEMLEANAERQEKGQETKAGYMASDTVTELGHRITGVLGGNPQLKAAADKYKAELSKKSGERDPKMLFASLAEMGVQAYSLVMTMALTAKNHLTPDSEKDAKLNCWDKRTQAQLAKHVPLVGDLCPPALADSQSKVENLGTVTEKYVSACHEAGDKNYLDIARVWHAVSNLAHEEMVTVEDADGNESEKLDRVYDLDVPRVLQGLVTYINGKRHELTPEQNAMLEVLKHRKLIRSEDRVHYVADGVETTQKTLAALACSVQAQEHIVLLYRALLDAQLTACTEQAEEGASKRKKLEHQCEQLRVASELDRVRSLIRMSVSEGCQAKLDAQDALIAEQPKWVAVTSLMESAKKAINEAEEGAKEPEGAADKRKTRKRTRSDSEVQQSSSPAQESDASEDENDGDVEDVVPTPKRKKAAVKSRPKARKTAPKKGAKPTLTAAQRRRQEAAELKKKQDAEGKTKPVSGGRRKPQPKKVPQKSTPKPKGLTPAQRKKLQQAELKKQKEAEDKELARLVKAQQKEADELAKLYGDQSVNKKPTRGRRRK